MEEIKIKKKLNKKPLIICLALAIVFGIIGFIDIKSNAAENIYSASLTSYSVTYEKGNFMNDRSDYKEYSSNSTMYLYTNQKEEITNDSRVHFYIISESYINSNYSCGNFTDNNGKVWYYSTGNFGGEFFSGYTGSCVVTGNGFEKIYILNKVYEDKQIFISDYKNGVLDYTQYIDYDNLPVDSSLPLIENVLANKISNKTGVNSGGHSVSAVKEFYDYVTWKNTGNYDIQVERYPIVKLYEGTFSPKFLEDFEGDFYLMEILSAGNSSFTYQVDLPYIELNYPNDYSFLGKITTDVAGFWDTCELYYGYRLRYVDGANNKASCWTYVIPEQSNIKWDYIEYPYYSYVEYVDGSLSDNSDATGSSGEYDSLDDIDNAKNELDNENDFKDKYEIVDGNADTQEVMNWLNTVVSFIKGTPSIVTSVLSFLPQPILYGMYITIFLGCIASAIAIIKALI